MSSQYTNIWLNNPAVLLKKGQLNQIWPREYMSRNEKINAITRLVIILTLLGFLVTQSYNFLFTGLVTLGVIAALYYAKEYKQDNKGVVQSTAEGFTNPEVYQALKSNFTNPTNKNPFLNVL